MKPSQVKAVLQNLFPEVGKNGKYALNLSQATALVNAVLAGEDGMSPLNRAREADFGTAREIRFDFKTDGGDKVETYTVCMEDGTEFVFEAYFHLYSARGWDDLSYVHDKTVLVSCNGVECKEETKDPFVWEKLQNAWEERNRLSDSYE